ncbi:MAG: glycosyltransferase family 2 protein [Patescibacteria group bacterium]|nr:glycosyltransferase family 2 protein [Patescibacteria group bacterium]
MKKLSIVISAYNEEKHLARTLQSVAWADELIVVDNQSSDKTKKIAEDFGAKVFSIPNNLMLNVNKNYGFEKAAGEWILNLDADEEVTLELAQEIKKVLVSPRYAGYWLPRKNIIFGKWIKHSLWNPDYHLRLFKKGLGKFPCQHIHEHLEIKGTTEYLKNYLIHYNYETISQFLYKMDKIYTENEVEVFTDGGNKLKWSDAIFFPVNDFLKTYFKQEGYKDGLHGLVLSLLQAFYSEIVFAKIWEKQKFVLEEPKNILPQFFVQTKKAAKDYRYWQNTVLGRESKFPPEKLFYRLRRKLGL